MNTKGKIGVKNELGRACLLGLLYLVVTSSWAQPAKPRLDSLLAVVASPTNDTADMLALDHLIEAYMTDDIDRAKAYAQQQLALARKGRNARWEVMSYKALANVYMLASRFDSALYFNAAGLAQMNSQNGPRDATLVLKLLLNRGALFTYVSAHDSALVYCLAAYERAAGSQQQEMKSKILNNLGVIYRKIDRLQDARATYEESIVLKRQLRDTLGLATTLANLGVAEMQTGAAEKALTSFQEAKRFYRVIGREQEALGVDFSLGQAYYLTGDKQLARSVWEHTLAQPGIKADARSLAYAFLGLADIANDANDPRAGEYAAQGRVYADYLAIPRLKADFDRATAEYFRRQAKMDSATFYYASYTTQIDTIFEVERTKAQQEVAEKFESQLKEAALEQQQLIIEKQRSRQIILSIGVLGLLLLGLVGAFLFRYRLRLQRSEAQRIAILKNKELEELHRLTELNQLKAMLEGQEAERNRIAQDLHDGLGGLLATVKVRLNSNHQDTQKADKLLDQACAEVRRIAHNMSPQNLQLVGLTGALEDIVAQLKLQGLSCDYEIGGQPNLRLAEEEQLMLLRILQELTHNVVKHAGAEKIFIQLLDQPHQLLLTVEDDGCGFEPQKVGHKGLGLTSIQSRVDYLKGHILFDSSLGVGTTVSLTIPV